MRKAKKSQKKKGPWGGKRPNTGGKRPGAGRKPNPHKSHDTFGYYLKVGLAKKIDEYAEMSGYTKGEIVELALGEFFDRLKREGFED